MSHLKPAAKGVTLIELVVAFGLFSLIGLILALAFRASTEVYRNVDGATDARTVLGKAEASLLRDLERTGFRSIRVRQGSNSLGPIDGDAVWFLSAINPATGEYMRKPDGSPFWQTNILYYTSVPSGHAALVGVNCSGGSNAEGYEVNCPHKVLIRKVIDEASETTDPTNSSTEEILIDASDIGNYLTRINGYDATAFSEAGLLDSSLPATNLLTFRVQLAPDSRAEREVSIQLGAVSTKTAQREVPIGQTALDQSRHLSTRVFSVFPKLP